MPATNYHAVRRVIGLIANGINMPNDLDNYIDINPDGLYRALRYAEAGFR